MRAGLGWLREKRLVMAFSLWLDELSTRRVWLCFWIEVSRSQMDGKHVIAAAIQPAVTPNTFFPPTRRDSPVKKLLLALVVSAAFSCPAYAYRTVTVTDGDSVILPAQGMATGLRLRLVGADTPELNGRCPEERALAQEARSRLIELTRHGVTVQSELEIDRYGRILSRLFDRAGRDIAEVLISEGLAHRYDGKGPRATWCPTTGGGR